MFFFCCVFKEMSFLFYFLFIVSGVAKVKKAEKWRTKTLTGASSFWECLHCKKDATSVFNCCSCQRWILLGKAVVLMDGLQLVRKKLEKRGGIWRFDLAER